MWPFNSIKSLEKSNILNQFTDWHSHVLPGVDDGIKSMEDSMRVINFYKNNGVKKLWLTPHIMEDCPNETALLKERFEELKAECGDDLDISLAAENMIDNLFEERLSKNDLLPIGNNKNHLLVETSYFNPPYGFNHIMDDIFSAGYFPILAHPERYRYMDREDYLRLKEKGVLFQMNLISVVGGFGESARKKAEWLLDNNMIDAIGSDLHRLSNFQGWLTKAPRKSKYLEHVLELARNPIQI